MKITIRYPQIMKMELASELEVSEKATIEEIKKIVFQKFWEDFNIHFKITTHGTYNNITLVKDDKDMQEITTTEMLKSCTKIIAIFDQYAV